MSYHNTSFFHITHLWINNVIPRHELLPYHSPLDQQCHTTTRASSISLTSGSTMSYHDTSFFHITHLWINNVIPRHELLLYHSPLDQKCHTMTQASSISLTSGSTMSYHDTSFFHITHLWINNVIPQHKLLPHHSPLDQQCHTTTQASSISLTSGSTMSYHDTSFFHITHLWINNVIPRHKLLLYHSPLDQKCHTMTQASSISLTSGSKMSYHDTSFFHITHLWINNVIPRHKLLPYHSPLDQQCYTMTQVSSISLTSRSTMLYHDTSFFHASSGTRL